MTAKKAGRKPSAAELKRQTAQERVKSDDNSAQMGELMSLVKQSLDGQAKLADEIENLKKRPAEVPLLAQHDPHEKAMNSVFGAEIGEEDYPVYEAPILPGYLVDAQKKFKARDVPASIPKTLDVGDLDVGQFEDRIMSPHGPSEDSLAPIVPEDSGIQLESGKMFSKEKYDMEMFMQEKVLVRLHDSTDSTAVPNPQAINGGRSFYFVRGEMQWVPRVAIEPLARAKLTTYSQVKKRLANGDETYVNVPHTVLMYPFEVVKDTPKGKQWLRHIIAQAY
jgi:hypothetical protein